MSGLAKYLLNSGKRVGGSDVCANEYTEELINNGAAVNFDNLPYDIDEYDLVVYTDAISENDSRLVRAKDLSKPVIPRGQFLYEISKYFNSVIAISGCHGKTTCSAMLVHIFAAAGKKFTSHIGGKDLKYSNFYSCGNDYFITEACEYKKNFLYLKPDVAVILNSDADHIECYGSEEVLKAAYIDFANKANKVVALYCDLPLKPVISFGFDKSADYCAQNIKAINGVCIFDVYEKGVKLGSIMLNIYGKHNVLNALAATAVARNYGISFEEIRAGLNDFKGVERRFEKLLDNDGVAYYADYAHHPNELRASLKTARNITKGKLFVVFQPHTYSRTKLLFNDFINVLSPLNNLMVYKTFAAREYFDDAGSALTLSQNLRKAHYGDAVADIKDFVSEAAKGDTVLFLGAGDIYFIAKQICAAINGV